MDAQTNNPHTNVDDSEQQPYATLRKRNERRSRFAQVVASRRSERSSLERELPGKRGRRRTHGR